MESNLSNLKVLASGTGRHRLDVPTLEVLSELGLSIEVPESPILISKDEGQVRPKMLSEVLEYLHTGKVTLPID